MEELGPFKARKRTGSPSLDLTIPVKVVQQFKIEPGVAFYLSVDSGEDLVLSYRKVSRKSRS